MHPVIDNISKFVTLNEQDVAAMLNVLSERKFKKKDLLLKEGDRCEYVFFIVKGAIRYYSLVDGEERTGQFFFENSWYTNYFSLISGEPSTENIEALEDSEILLLHKKDLDNLYENYMAYQKFGRLIAEQVVMRIKHKNQNYISLSNEERYLKIIKDRPNLIERVSLKHIASFLGMTPESLSRIRSRISNQSKS